MGVVDQVKELVPAEGLLTNLIGVEDVADLKDLVLQEVQLDADPLAKVFHAETFYLH